jgi:hypothetical protein
VSESEFFNVEGEDNEQGEDTFEPDPATIAFLDQESAAFAEIADEFESTYGFRHDCHCDSDYAEGKVGEVTECFAGMITESLAACANLNHQNRQLNLMVKQLIEMNNTLMDAAVSEAGEDYVIQAEIEQLEDEQNDSDADQG